MNDLPGVLGTVRARIARFRAQAINEENTKHALIEPILKALGWDVEDLDEVRCEYKLERADNPVDYALFVRGNLRLFLEAKALGENLDRWANVVMGYAGVAGIVEWIVLTDGNEYRVYNAHAKVPVAQKLFKRVVVAGDEPGVADTLALLSKPQLQGTTLDDLWQQFFVDRQVKQAVEALVRVDPPTDFVRLIHKRTPAVSVADVRHSLLRATFSIEYREERQPPPPPAPPKVAVTLSDLIAAGAIRPPLEIETPYKGRHLTARIEADGTVSWNGASYDSLSTAAGMARKSIIGAPPGREYPQTNGWGFWRFRDSDGRLVPVDELRQRHVGP